MVIMVPPHLPAFQFPRGEAAEVQVKRVQAGRLLHANLLELHLNLPIVAPDGHVAHGARESNAVAAPCAIRPPNREHSTLDRHADFLAEDHFVGH